MVYTDYIHIIADSLEELHSFCKAIGIKRCWFENKERHPHYDVPKYKKTALLQGVRDKKCQHKTTRELVEIIQQQQATEKWNKFFERLPCKPKPIVYNFTPDAMRKFEDILKRTGAWKESSLPTA